MAGHFETGGIDTFINGIETSARRLKTNIDAIIEKYNKPFPNDDEINLSTLSFNKDKGSVRGIKGCHKLGTSQLRSTRRKDELLQSQIGQKSTYVDPNVSMAITRQYIRYIRRADDIENEPSDNEDGPSDREGEPSDAETIDSDSSAEGDEDSDEEEEGANESEDFESENEDLEKEESSERFMETSSDKNNFAGSWRKQVSMGRKELENENMTEVDKSGRVNKSGIEQHNERGWDGEREHVKKTRRVHIKSVREVVNKSGREQLTSGKELVNEDGRAQFKNERVQASKNERVNKIGRVLATENKKVNKSERVLATENKKVNKSGRFQAFENESEMDHESGSEHVNKTIRMLIKSNRERVNESEKAQLKSGKELANRKGEELANKKGEELANKKGGIQLKSGRGLSNETGKDHIVKGGKKQSGAEQANSKKVQNSKCGTELGIENGQGQNCADVTKSDFFNTSCLNISTSSTLRNLSLVSHQSSKPVMKKTSVKKCAIIPSYTKRCTISQNLQSAQNESITRSDEFFNTFCLDSSTSSTLRNLSFVSYQSSKRDMKETSVKKCAITPSDNKCCTMSQNLKSAQNETFFCENTSLSVTKPGDHISTHLSYKSPGHKKENETFVCENTSLSVTKPGDHISTHLSYKSPGHRKAGPALLKKKSLADWRNLQDDDSANMDTTYVKSDTLSISGKFQDPVSESQAQIDSSRRKSENGMKKRASTSSFMNLQTDHSVNMNVTYDRPGLFNISSTNKDPVSELELSPSSGTGRFGDVSPRTRSTTASRNLQSDYSSTGRFGDVSPRTRSATASRNLQSDHSSTGRFGDVSPRTRSTTASRNLQSDHSSTARFGDVSPRARSTTASRNLQSEHSSTGRFGDVSPRTRSTTASRNLQSDHSSTGRFGDVSPRTRSTTASRNLQSELSSSGSKMPTNRKSENDKNIYLSPFPSLQKTDCSANMDCSVIVDHSVNMDVTFIKSGLFEDSFRHESPVSEPQIPLRLDMERYEKPVSELHLFSSSETGRYEDMSQRSRSATASHNSQSDHPSSAKGKSTNVLQKAKSGRKSQADHSSKVNITPAELSFDNSPRKSKSRITEHGLSKTGCRVSLGKKSATSFQAPCTNLSSPSSRQSAAGCQNWKTDSLSEAVNNSTHVYNLRSKKPCNVQANMSSGDVSLTSSLRNLNINSRAPHLLSPQPNLAPVRSSLTSPRSDLTSPRSNLSSENSILTSPHSNVKSPCCKLTSSPSNLKSPRSKLTSLNSSLVTPPCSNSKSPHSNLASLQSKLTSPDSNLTPSCTSLTSSHSSLTSSHTKSPSLCTIFQSQPSSSASSTFSLPSLPTNLASASSKSASPCPKSASPCSKVSSPPSNTALSLFKPTSPATKLTSPSNLAAPLTKSMPSNLTFSRSNNAPSHSNVESPVMFTPSGFSTSSSSSLECLPFSMPYEYSNSSAPSSISTLSRSNLATHHSSVSKQHNSNEGLTVHALPEPHGYVENLVKCGLYVESPNYVQKGVQTEPQCQSTNFENICSCFHQFLLLHGYSQDKWASPRCENATNKCSQISASSRLKRKVSCSFTSDYFTDISASPKRLQTCSAVRLDDDQVINISLTRPSVKTQCLPEPACPFHRHIQQQPHIPQFCSLHRSKKTASPMEESNHTSFHQISGHDFSRTDENAVRRFAVAKKKRDSGSYQFANPGSSNQQPVKDNWYCLRHCAAREDCSCRPPSRTNSRVCDQNNHDVSVQVSPHVDDSRVCEWINASRGVTNLRSNSVRHTSCFPKMQQIQMSDCLPGQFSASVISSRVASLRHAREVSSTSQAPCCFQANHHGNPQTGFKDRIRQPTEYQNHALSCHLCASTACGGACNPCDKVVHSSMESQVQEVWKEIQAERLSADTRSGNMNGSQNKSSGLGSSERLWSESKDTGGRLDESVHPKVKTSGGQTSRHQDLKISTFFYSSLSTTAGELPSFAENHSPSPKFKVPKTSPSKLKVKPQNSMFPESFIEQFSPLNPARKDGDNSVVDDEQKIGSVQPRLKINGNSIPRALCHKKSGIVSGDSIEQDGQINHSIDCQSEVSHASWQSISSKPQHTLHSSASAMSETFSLPCNRSSNQSNFGSAANSRLNYKQRDCESTSRQVSLKSLDYRASTPIRIAPRLPQFCLDDTLSTICPADSAETVRELNDNKNRASHEVTQSETFVGDSDSFEEVDLLN